MFHPEVRLSANIKVRKHIMSDGMMTFLYRPTGVKYRSRPAITRQTKREIMDTSISDYEAANPIRNASEPAHLDPSVYEIPHIP